MFPRNFVLAMAFMSSPLRMVFLPARYTTRNRAEITAPTRNPTAAACLIFPLFAGVVGTPLSSTTVSVVPPMIYSATTG